MTRLFVLLIVFAMPALAQEEGPAPCGDDDNYSRLDFWLGEWDVYVDEELVGTNRIEKVLGGCAVFEHWRGRGGGEGKSVFFIDGNGVWQQVWVTEWATRTGGVKEKTMQAMPSAKAVRFQGEISTPGGKKYLDRTTLTPLGDGSVRQHIEVSEDNGQNWQSSFDAVYRAREPLSDGQNESEFPG